MMIGFSFCFLELEDEIKLITTSWANEAKEIAVEWVDKMKKTIE